MQTYDRVKVSVASGGAGDLVLGGAVLGFRPFAGVVADGAVSYVIEDGLAWEVGVGIWNNGTNTLSGRTVRVSSDGAAPIAASGDAKVFVAPSAAELNNLAGRVDVQVFDADGVWLKPAGAKLVLIDLVGGGGGGSSGFVGASGANGFGGSGGSGGGRTRGTLRADAVPNSVAITVGQGGAGGAASTGTANAGSAGTASTFGSLFAATGGGGANGGGLGAAGQGFNLDASVGGTGGTGGGAGAVLSTTFAGTATTGGSGGGNITGTGTVAGSGGSINYTATQPANPTIPASTPGGTPNNPGVDGVSLDIHAVGIGGTGGGASITGNGGKGGNGGRGCGGGGGGAAFTGFLSGAGGKGGNGRVVVITSF